MSDVSIHTHGKIIRQVRRIFYQVSLPNGKIVPAHLSKQLADQGAGFAENSSVLLELTPYDFDSARILGPAEESLANAEAAEDRA